MIKKVGKWLGIVYFLAFSLTVIHVPSGTKNSLREEPLLLPLIPMVSPVIVSSYLQLFGSSVWPWSSPAKTLKIHDLIEEKGSLSSPLYPKSLAVNVEDQVWTHGINLLLTSETYSATARNAALPEVNNGAIIRIGYYFCQGNSDRSGIYNRLFGPVRCVWLSKSRGEVYWHVVGDPVPRKMRFRGSRAGTGLG